MAFDAVVVDLDGTVWDSFPWYANLLGRLCGRDAESLLDQLASGENLIRIIEQVGVTRNRFYSECKDRAEELDFFPGVYEALTDLWGTGIPLGVVTSLPGALAEPICEAKGISRLLSAFEPYKFGRPSKPNPHGILDVLASIGVVPSPSACYVGDLPEDARAAHRAGISFVWARYGYGTLADEPRMAEIDAFAEILDL